MSGNLALGGFAWCNIPFILIFIGDIVRFLSLGIFKIALRQFITKCVRYYKVCQVLQSVTDCYYKVRQVLQSAAVITKWDLTMQCNHVQCNQKLYSDLLISTTWTTFIKILLPFPNHSYQRELWPCWSMCIFDSILSKWS